jgi:hypothetical protein
MRKRDDKNYVNLTGYITPTLAERFRNHCLKKGIDYSTALEILVGRWVEKEPEQQTAE